MLRFCSFRLFRRKGLRRKLLAHSDGIAISVRVGYRDPLVESPKRKPPRPFETSHIAIRTRYVTQVRASRTALPPSPSRPRSIDRGLSSRLRGPLASFVFVALASVASANREGRRCTVIDVSFTVNAVLRVGLPRNRSGTVCQAAGEHVPIEPYVSIVSREAPRSRVPRFRLHRATDFYRVPRDKQMRARDLRGSPAFSRVETAIAGRLANEQRKRDGNAHDRAAF